MVVPPPHLNFLRGVRHSTLPSQCDATRTTPSSPRCTHPSLSVLAWFVCYSHMTCSLGVRKRFILRAVRKRLGVVRDQRADSAGGTMFLQPLTVLATGTWFAQPAPQLFKAADGFKRKIIYTEMRKLLSAVSAFSAFPPTDHLACFYC